MTEEADNEKETVFNLVLKGGISNVRYIWHSENSDNTCEQCQALDGTEYGYEDEIPERPHPNCQCTVEIVEDSNENNRKSDTDDRDENTNGKKKKDKKAEEPCNCREEISTMLDDFQIALEKADNTKFEAENICDQLETLKNKFESYSILGSTDFQNKAQNIIDKGIENIREFFDALYQRIGTFCDFISNYADLIFLKWSNNGEYIDGSAEYYHTKANCQSAQRGEIAEATAEILGESREFFDFYKDIY